MEDMKTPKQQIEELKTLDISYSDTQGIAGAIALKYGVDEELILKYCNEEISIQEVFN